MSTRAADFTNSLPLPDFDTAEMGNNNLFIINLLVLLFKTSYQPKESDKNSQSYGPIAVARTLPLLSSSLLFVLFHFQNFTQ